MGLPFEGISGASSRQSQEAVDDLDACLWGAENIGLAVLVNDLTRRFRWLDDGVSFAVATGPDRSFEPETLILARSVDSLRCKSVCFWVKVGVRELESLISELRSVCASFPDKRTASNRRYSMADIGLLTGTASAISSDSFGERPARPSARASP